MVVSFVERSRGRPPAHVDNYRGEAKKRKFERRGPHHRQQQPADSGVCRQRILEKYTRLLLLLLVVFCASWRIPQAGAIHVTRCTALRNVVVFAVVLASAASPLPVHAQTRTPARSASGNLRVELLLHMQGRHGVSPLPPATFQDAKSAANRHTNGKPQQHEQQREDRLSSHATRAAAAAKDVSKDKADLKQTRKSVPSESASDAALHHSKSHAHRDPHSLSADDESIAVYKNPLAGTFAAGGTAPGSSTLGGSIGHRSAAGNTLGGSAAVFPPRTWIYRDMPEMPPSQAAASGAFVDHTSAKNHDAETADNEPPALTATRLYAAASIFVCAIAGALPPLLFLQRQQESRSSSSCTSSNWSGRSGGGGDAISISTARYIRLTMSFTGGVLLGVGLLHLLPSAERQIAASRRAYAFAAGPTLPSAATNAQDRTPAVFASAYPGVIDSSATTNTSLHLADRRVGAQPPDNHQIATAALPTAADAAVAADAAAAAEPSHKNRQDDVQQAPASAPGHATHLFSLPQRVVSPEAWQQVLLTGATLERRLQQQQLHTNPSTSQKGDHGAPAAAGAAGSAGGPSPLSASFLVGSAVLLHPHQPCLFYPPSAAPPAAATALRLDTDENSPTTAAAAALPLLSLPRAAEAEVLQPPAAAFRDEEALRDVSTDAAAAAFAPAASALWRTERSHEKASASSSSGNNSPPPPNPSRPFGPGPPQTPPPELPYPLASLCCLFGVLLVMALEAVAEAEHAHHHPHTQTHARTHVVISDVHREESVLLQQQQHPEQHLLQHVVMVSSVEPCSAAKPDEAQEHQQLAHVHRIVAPLLYGGLTSEEKAAVAEGVAATAADAPAAGANGAAAGEAAAATVEVVPGKATEALVQQSLQSEVQQGCGFVETDTREVQLCQILPTAHAAEQQQEQRRTCLLLSPQDQHCRAGGSAEGLQQQPRLQAVCAGADRQADIWGVTAAVEEEVKLEWSAGASAPAAATEDAAQVPLLPAQHGRHLCNTVGCSCACVDSAAATAARGAAASGSGEAAVGRSMDNNRVAAEDVQQQEQQREGAAALPASSSPDAHQKSILLNCARHPQSSATSSNGKTSNSDIKSESSSSMRSPSEKREGAEESVLRNQGSAAACMQRGQLPRRKAAYVTSCSAECDFSTGRSTAGSAAAAACVGQSPVSPTRLGGRAAAAAGGGVGKVSAAVACRSAPLVIWGGRGGEVATAASPAAAAPAAAVGRVVHSGRQKHRCCKIQRDSCCRVMQSKTFPLSRSGYASGCAFTAAAELCALPSESPCCHACSPSSGEHHLPSSSRDRDGHRSVDSSGRNCMCHSSYCLDNSGGGSPNSSSCCASPAEGNLASPFWAAWKPSGLGVRKSTISEAAPAAASPGVAACGTPTYAAGGHAGRLDGKDGNSGVVALNRSYSFVTSQPLQHVQRAAVARSSSDPNSNSSSSSSSSNRVSSVVNGLRDALLLRGRQRSGIADSMHEDARSAAAAVGWEGKNLASAGAAAAGAAAPGADSRVQAIECSRRASHTAAAKDRNEGRTTSVSPSLNRCTVNSKGETKSSSRSSSRSTGNGSTRWKRNLSNKAQQWCFWKRTDNFTNTPNSSSLCFPLLAASHSCCSSSACSRSNEPCDSCDSGPDCGPLRSAESSLPCSYSSRPASLMFCGRQAVGSSLAATAVAAAPGAAHGERAAEQHQHCASPLRHHRQRQQQQQHQVAQQQQQQEPRHGSSGWGRAGGRQRVGVHVRRRLSHCTNTASACCRRSWCASRSRSRLSGCGRCSSNDEGSLLPPYGTSSSSASFADELDMQSREGRAGGTKNMLVSSVLMLALSFHSLMEGVTLGTTLRPHVVAFAVLVHKGLESFALGSSLLQAQTRLRTFLWQMGLFASMTPMGVLLGLSITLWTREQQHQLSQLRQQEHVTLQEQQFPGLQQQQQLSSISLYSTAFSSFISWYFAIAAAVRAAAQALLPLLPGILTGIGSGTFLHVSLLECVAPQLMRSRAEGKTSLLAVIAAVALGAALMCLLA